MRIRTGIFLHDLGIAYEKLVPVLIRALQESNARIAALEERLAHA